MLIKYNKSSILNSLLSSKTLFKNILISSIFLLSILINLYSEQPTRKLIRVVVDLNIGESQKVTLINGEKVDIKLIDIKEIRDDIRSAIRSVNVKVSVNGKEIMLNSANYNLPVKIENVQIDCPITKGYYKNSDGDAWKLERDARLRLWPKDSPYITPGTFAYPIKQLWFANDTQMSNEPVFVDWGEGTSSKSIYYHAGLDFGGCEGLTEILSAVDGLIIIAGKDSITGYENTPAHSAYDEIFILDDRGWIYEYAHLFSIDPSVKPGKKVKMGQKIGLLGKEGGSGGWTHLHFQIHTKLSSGKWGTEEGYAYIWEAYVNQYKPPLIGVARPHHLAYTGQTVTINGRKSMSFSGKIVKYEWIFYNGSTASGPTQERTYNQPGTYSEVLKVTDSNGNIDYDYVVVQVRDKINPEKMPPSIHAVYHPTFNIKLGDPVIFQVRTFRSEVDNEVWDFGDGTPKTIVKSVMEKNRIKGKYAETIHKFTKLGNYLVRVERSNELGFKAIAHLHIEVVSPK